MRKRRDERMGGLAEAFSKGGFFMYPITALLALGAAVIIERFYFLQIQFNLDGRKFFIELRKLLGSGDLEAARDFCGNAPLPRILRAGIESAMTWKRGKKAIGLERIVQNAVDEEALAVIPSIEKRIHYLSMIANVSTLMGLLGTIMGLIDSFAAVARPEIDPSQKALLLADGISKAMNTTAYGLMVAIPCMIAYSILQTKASKIVDEIDEFSVKTVNLIATGEGE